MKKTFITTIIEGMFSRAICDFVSKSNDTATPKENDYEISEETSTTTSNDGMEDFDSIGLQVGDMAPDFELTTLDGENMRLSEFRGQRVMLNFWALLGVHLVEQRCLTCKNFMKIKTLLF